MEDHVEVYRDKAGEHRWRYKAANGQVLAESGEGYQNVTDLMRSLGIVTHRQPTIIETKDVVIGPNAIRVEMLPDTIDRRPHSRACGMRCGPGHGPHCAKDCPTCGGR